MGFFSSVLAPVLAGAAGAILGPEVGTALTSVFGTTAKAVVGGATITPAQIAAGTVTGQIIAATGGAVCPSGTGAMRKITIVQTLNAAGQIVKSRTHKGGVAVFQSDVTAARRVARQVRQLDKRMPRKTVTPSRTKQLTDRVVNNALERAGDDPSCPK